MPAPGQAHLGNKRQLTTSKSLIQSHSLVDETVAQDMEGQGDGNQHKGELSPVASLVLNSLVSGTNSQGKLTAWPAAVNPRTRL